MNPKTFMRYLPYYEEKLKQTTDSEREMADVTAWLNGTYVSHAIAQLGKHRYPEKPLNIFGVKALEEHPADVPGEEKAKPSDGFAAFAYVFNMERHRKLGIKEGEVVNNG